MSKYVDIGVDEGIGLKDGSDVDNYMGWNQFAPNVNPTLWNIIIEDDFLIRGSRHIDGGAFLLNGTTSQTMKLQPWDLLIHGPWRLSSTTQLVLNGFVIVEGAILACIEDSSGVEITNGKFQDPPLDIPVCDVINTAIISPRYICFESGNASNTFNIKGCRFCVDHIAYVDNEISFWDSTITVNFVDCVLEGNVVAYDGVMIMDYCATISDPGTGTITNSQLDWEPGSILTPDWDAVQSLWDIAIINAGITQVGSGTYTGYETGLWGNPRIAI